MKDSLDIPDADAWSLMLLEMASIWKMLARRALIEANEGPVVVESFRGVDRQGNALVEKKVNPALAFFMKSQDKIREIGDELLATRKARAKLGDGDRPLGPEEYARQVEAKIKAFRNGAEQQRIDKIRAKEGRPALSPPIVPDEDS